MQYTAIFKKAKSMLINSYLAYILHTQVKERTTSVSKAFYDFEFSRKKVITFEKYQ